MLLDWLHRVRQGRLNVIRRSRRAVWGPQATQSQTLEPRVLLTASPVGPEFQVNTYTTGFQQLDGGNAIATDADGDFVVTWTSYGQDGDRDGVFAQRFNAAGEALGGEFQVNSYTSNTQLRSAVAMDADGNFVITWDSYSQDSSGFGIFAQRYNALGVAQGSEFRVNSTTTSEQFAPTVAMDANGNFVVTWSSYLQDGSGDGIFAQMYNGSGVAQGGEFQVNSYTTGSQFDPAVAMDADGDFVVTWSSSGQDGSAFGVFAQRYNAAGIAQGAEFQVNTSTMVNQQGSTVAMDADGDFVIAWQEGGPKEDDSPNDGAGAGIFAQRYNASGVAQGLEFQMNTTTTDSQSQPSLAIDADGDFVVTWTSFNQDGNSTGVYSQQYNAAGTPKGGEVLVNTFTTGAQMSASVAMDADGDYVVAWMSFDQINFFDVFAQRYDEVGPDAADAAGATVTDLLVAGDRLLIGEQLVSPPTIMTVVFSEDLATTGVGSVTDTANWALSLNGVDVSNLISGVTFGLNMTTTKYEAIVTFTAGLMPGDYVLTVREAVTDVAGNALDGDQNGMPGTDFTRAFQVRKPVAAGSEFLVNTYTTNRQSDSAVAMDAAGNYVVTWHSYTQDGSDYGIFAQRYNAAGVAQGSEFQVNTYTTGNQLASAVAMDADGDFVVTWWSDGQDGSGTGVFAQRYNAAGVAQGSEFQVNTYTSGTQILPSVAMDADGNFVITWHGSGLGDFGVFAQRYNAAGVAQGSEIQVNAYTTGTQRDSAVAMDADGDFVVTWSSNYQDGGNYGVFSQRYNATGVAQGSEFRVNTYTSGNQRSSVVAMDADGDFVVTWSSSYQDGSLYGVFAQRYSAAGIAQGSEFQVNTYTNSMQSSPTVALDADGDFVVTWSSNGQDGNNTGVFAQRYNAAGIAQGSEFQVNTYTTSVQQISAVVLDADGDFVVTWQSFGQDGSHDGVFAQRFAGGTVPVANDAMFSFAENQTVGYVVGSVTATGSPTFSLTSGNTGNAFAINAATGQITVNTAAAINYEVNPTFTLTVTADGGGMLTDTATVTINLTDVNETPTMNGGMVTIAENRPNGAVIGTFTGTDPDAGDTLTYSITAGDTGNAFAINPSTGQITVNSSAAVNFELNPSFTLTVQATDAGMLADTDTVTVTVSDLNEQPYAIGKSFALAENRPAGYVLGNITTGDPDAGQTLTYSITGGNTGNAFAINSMTGQLTVNSAAAINFETNPSFTLQITATDNGSPAQSRIGTAAITVTNLNEQPYAFSKSFSLAENRPAGYVLGNVTTGDPDAGQTLTYSITGGNTGNAFAINGTNGQLTVNSSAAVNFEANPTFNLQITATDNGSPQQSRVGTAVINLTNLNEQPNAFGKSFSLSENRSVGYVLGNIATSDSDAGQTLTYSITGGNTGNAFSINTMTGQLTVNSPAAINYEVNPTFNLQITATDNGSPQQSRVGTAVIHLVDLNEQPNSGNQTLGNIAENSPNGTVVGTVGASDPDAGQTLSYAITGGNPNNAFAINSSTGQVTVSNSAQLDFETTPTFNLQITITDNGTPQQSRVITGVVNLIDVLAARPLSSRTRSALSSSLSGTASQETQTTAKAAASTPAAAAATSPSASSLSFWLTQPLSFDEESPTNHG